MGWWKKVMQAAWALDANMGTYLEGLFGLPFMCLGLYMLLTYNDIAAKFPQICEQRGEGAKCVEELTGFGALITFGLLIGGTVMVIRTLRRLGILKGRNQRP